MKIWIINNTKFGHKNNSKEWLQNMIDYFDNHFIPFIQKNAKPDDKLIHLGNIFSTSETINITTLLKVKELFDKLSNIIPIIILDGYNEKSGVSKLLKTDKIENMWYPSRIDDIQFIPIHSKPLELISTQKIIFLNNRIDIDILKKYPSTLFICGYHDDRKENENIIHVGAPYQFEKTLIDKGFYVIDTETLKYKFIKNNYSPNYNTITITDISQIDNIDSDFVNKNHVSIIIDKSLVDDKKLKIDMLLSKYNFESVSYLNDINKVELVDSSSMDMEELIREKIKNSDNPELMSEFNNIVNIWKERY